MSCEKFQVLVGKKASETHSNLIILQRGVSGLGLCTVFVLQKVGFYPHIALSF